MAKTTGVLAHHKTTGTLSAKADAVSGKLKIFGVNGVLLRDIEAKLPLSFTGPVRRGGVTGRETLQVHVTATSKIASTGTGVDITVHVADEATWHRQQEIWKNITGR